MAGRFCSSCRNHCPTKLPAILGKEVAGVVAQAGDGVAGFAESGCPPQKIEWHDVGQSLKVFVA